MALVAFAFSLLSLAAIIILHYASTADNLLPYYQRSGKNLVSEAFQNLSRQHIWMLGWAPFLFVLYYYELSRKEKLLSGVFASLFFASNIVFPICMHLTDNRKILLPCLFLLYFPGLFLLCLAVVRLLYQLLDRKTRFSHPPELTDKYSVLRLFAITLCVILVAWAPVMLICYPGSLDFDTLRQLKEYSGIISKDASNPILVTYLYGFMYTFGKNMLSESKGLSLIMLLQAFSCATAFSLSAVKSYQYTRSRFFYVLSLVLVIVVPVWPGAVQFIIKDTLHAACYLLFCIQFYECIRKPQPGWGDFGLLLLTAFLAAFTRKAALYIVVALLIMMLFLFRKKCILQIITCTASILLLNMGLNMILPSLDIRTPAEVENYSMPLQIMGAYVRDYGDELSADEIEIFNRTLDFERVRKEYTPMISDPIKATFHGNSEDHEAFWSLFRTCILRHPQIIIKSLVMSSFEHMNPLYNGDRAGIRIYIEADESFHNLQFKYGYPSDLFDYYKAWNAYFPLYLFLGTGSYGWLAVLMAGYALRRRSLPAFTGIAAVLIPLFGLIFSHVNGLMRYGYPVIATAPLTAFFVVMIISRKGEAPVTKVQTEKETIKRKINPLVIMDWEDEHLLKKGVDESGK